MRGPGAAVADSPPHGQGDGEPYGYGVERLREVRVEQHEQRPVVREAVGARIVGRPHVHVIGERHVLDHDEQVGHGQPGQYGVGGRHHFLARQHRDVQHVGHRAERAHQQARVTVVMVVHVVQPDQNVAAVRAVRRSAARAGSPVPAALHARRRSPATNNRTTAVNTILYYYHHQATIYYRKLSEPERVFPTSVFFIIFFIPNILLSINSTHV